MVTESAESDVDISDPAFGKETTYAVSTFNGTSIIARTQPVKEVEMTLLPYILGVTVGVFVMCVTMGAVFITLIVVLIKKKVQKKRLKAIV